MFVCFHCEMFPKRGKNVIFFQMFNFIRRNIPHCIGSFITALFIKSHATGPTTNIVLLNIVINRELNARKQWFLNRIYMGSLILLQTRLSFHLFLVLLDGLFSIFEGELKLWVRVAGVTSPHSQVEAHKGTQKHHHNKQARINRTCCKDCRGILFVLIKDLCGRVRYIQSAVCGADNCSCNDSGRRGTSHHIEHIFQQNAVVSATNRMLLRLSHIFTSIFLHVVHDH